MPLIELVDDTISQPAGRLTPVPNPAAPASDASAASQAAFGIYPASGINRRARSPQPGGSVLDNPAPLEQRGPANPYADWRLSTSAGGPLIPEVRRAVESSWDAGTPDQRALLESADNFVGQVARERAQKFRAIDAARQANPATQGMGGVLDDADPRAEFRASRLVVQGEDPQFAQTAGREGARLGVLPGNEIGALGGTVQPSSYDFDTAALFDPNKPGNGLNNPVARGLVKAGAGIGKSYSGLFEFQADALGLDTAAKAARQMGGQMRSTEEAIGERGDFLTRNFEGAVSSIVQQLPLLVGGAALGSKAIPLAGMAVQAFGQEYSDGKAKNQNAVQATYRASLMAALEVIGARFGLGQTMDALRAAARGAPTGEIGKLLLEALKREIPGELLTTTGQFAVDKFAGGGVGLNPNATFDDYLKQVADTIAQTLMQSGMMGAGTTGVSAGVRFLRNGGVNAGVAEADAERAKQQALARWAALSGGVQPQGAAGAPVPAGRVDPSLGRLVPLDDEAASPDGRIEPSLGADPAMPGAGAFPAFGAGAGGTAFPPANGLQGVVPGLSGATSPTPQADPMMRLAELQIVTQQRSLTPQEQAEFQRLTQQLDGEAAPPAGPAAPPVTTASASPWASTGAPLRQTTAPGSILPPAAQGVLAPAAPVPDGASAGATPPVASTAQSGTYTVADAISADGPVEETVRLVVRPDGTSAILRGNGDLIDVTEMVRAGFSAERAIAQAMGHDTSGANVKAAPPADDAIQIQNRDRTRAASVAQMQAIARNPDYGRTGVSRTPDSGAPMVFAVGDQTEGSIPARNFGRQDVAVMADGTRVPFRYAVVDATLVQPSNFFDGSTNPAFASTQPGTLKALNNARTAGLRGAYQQGTAGTYTAEMTADAATHGVDPAAIALTPNPILVRVYSEASNVANMGVLSQGQGLGMSAVELAQQDAPLLDTGVIGLWRGGDVTDAGNRDFVRAFVGKLYSSGQDIAELMTDRGELSQSGRRRIDAAMMAAAYGDPSLVGELYDSTDTDIAAIGGAMRQAAGRWAQLRDAARNGMVEAEFDFTPELLQAVRMVQTARRGRQSLAEMTQQVDLETGRAADPLLVAALRLLYGGQNFTRARGREKVAALLGAYTDAAFAAGAGGGLFGDTPTALQTIQALTASADGDANAAAQAPDPRAAGARAGASPGAPPGADGGELPSQGAGARPGAGADGSAGQRPGTAAPGPGADRAGAGGAGPTVGAGTQGVTPPAAAPTAGAAPAAPDAPALRIAGSEPQFEAQQVYNSLFDAMNGGLPAVADQELRARFADRQIAGPTGLLPAGQQLLRRLNEIGSSRDAQPVVDEVLGRRAWPGEDKPTRPRKPVPAPAAQPAVDAAPAAQPAAGAPRATLVPGASRILRQRVVIARPTAAQTGGSYGRFATGEYIVSVQQFEGGPGVALQSVLRQGSAVALLTAPNEMLEGRSFPVLARAAVDLFGQAELMPADTPAPGAPVSAPATTQGASDEEQRQGQEGVLTPAAGATGRQPGAPADSPLLTAQTPEDLRARAEREQAAEDAAKAERAAEQERLRREAQQRDTRARADQTVDDFELGRSADEQMSGMDDMFGDAPAAPSADAQARARAQQDLDSALGDLGDILGRGTRLGITPEQEQKLLPVLTRVMDAAFRLGYYKFKDAARFVLDTIRQRLGGQVSDQITLDHLQGAYIGMAGKYAGQGASTKREVIAIESLDELGDAQQEAPDVPSGNTDLERDRQDAEDADGVGQADGGPRATGGDRARGGQAGSAGRGRADDPGLPADGAAAGGERGDQPMDRGPRSDAPEEFPARADDGTPSDDPGIDGVQPDEDADPDARQAASGAPDRAAKRAQQRQADTRAVVAADLQNIRDTLPFLDAFQQEDVHKAERRFAKADGYGMLFTNGTGTGKTYTGLGVVKRFARQGKTNTLIVVPDDKIATDWIASGEDLGLTITKLPDTKTAGKGIVVATYANVGMNDELARRDWDLVVADEAHTLMQSAEATETRALASVRAISLHPRGAMARAQMLHGELTAEAKRLSEEARLARMSDDQREWIRAVQLEADAEKAWAKWGQALERVREDVKARQLEARPRLVALSATPFSYVPNVDWAEGYLFSYDTEDVNTEGREYNRGSPSDQFYMRHFGYRMRYNKLTKPDGNVDVGLMERHFNTWLQRQGVLSGRALEVEADYDRRFVMVQSAIGNDIDQAIEWLRERAAAQRNADDDPNTQAYSQMVANLEEALYGRTGHLTRRYLLEAIKAKEVISHVREHLARGRKVVVFHDFKKGGASNPFAFADMPVVTGEERDGNGVRLFPTKELRDQENARRAAYNAAVAEFRRAFPTLAGRELSDLLSPIERFTREFADVLLINGDVPKTELLRRYTAFNDDARGPMVALVQSAKNKGWSGHDTTGKHQRVLFNLGLPTQPSMAIQQEGRIYRRGVVSNAIIRYLNTGTDWERWAFAQTIASRSGTVENLGMGERARAMRDAFINAFEGAEDFRAGHEGEGTGGKAIDRTIQNVISLFDRARTLYWATAKKNSRTKSEEGSDYFATPEPLGLKMVEWADLRDGEDALEPSAGHGAIARWFGEKVNRTAIEQSPKLSSRLALFFDGKIVRGDFEDHHVVNKYDGIVMNPPFGTAGRTAVDHLMKAATHLREGGRIVAIIPTGPAADAKFDKWFYDSEGPAKGLNLIGEVRLPGVTFERAGTGVMTRVVVIERTRKGADPASTRKVDLTDAKDINELFARLEGLDLVGKRARPEGQAAPAGQTPSRPEREAQAAQRTEARAQGEELARQMGLEVVEYTTAKGKMLKGVVRPDLTKAQAQAIDPFTWNLRGAGFFVRLEHLDKLLEQHPMPAGEQRGLAQEEAAAYQLNNPGANYDLFPDELALQPAPAPRMAPRAPQRAGATTGAAPAENAAPAVPVVAVRASPTLPGVYHVTDQLVSVNVRDLPVARVKTWQDAVDALQGIGEYAVEHFDALVTDKAGKPLAVVGAFKGATSMASVFPTTVLAEALRIKGAATAWGVHNHPSGNADLSRADEALNQALAATFRDTSVRWAGLAAVGNGGDWRVVEGGGDVFYGGKVSASGAVAARVPVVERLIRRVDQSNVLITSPSQAKDVVQTLSGGQPGIVFLAHSNRVTAWVPMTRDEMGALKTGGRLERLLNSVSLSGAAAYIVSMPSQGTGKVEQAATKNIANALAKLDLRMLDVIDPVTRISWAERGVTPIGSGGATLYDISSKPAPAAEQSPADTAATFTEQVAYTGYPTLPVPRVQAARNLRKLVDRLGKGEITETAFVDAVRVLSNEMATAASARMWNRLGTERQRGADLVREKLLAARRREEIDPDGVEFALWALGKNPALAAGLGISVRTAGAMHEGVAGDYNPASEVIRLFKGQDNEQTAVHEILHHAERMMTAPMQARIRRDWARALARAVKTATPEQRDALALIGPAMAGDSAARRDLMQSFRVGILTKDAHYHLVSPSEFWAVNAAGLLWQRFDARDSGYRRVLTWMREMLERVKSLLGLRANGNILRALDGLLNPERNDGEARSSRMLQEVMPGDTLMDRRTVRQGRIRRTIDSLVDLAQGQAGWKDWYSAHQNVIQELFGQDADLFQQILSATSQMQTVKGNVTVALRAYEQMVTGQPFRGYLEGVIRNLERIRAGQGLQGPKIGDFQQANVGDDAAMAIDRHIAQLLFNTSTPSARQIESAKKRIRVVAARLGWTPRQAQAALWAANQVRLGRQPGEVASYAGVLETRRDAVAALRARLGRGGDPGLRPGGAADAGPAGAGGPDGRGGRPDAGGDGAGQDDRVAFSRAQAAPGAMRAEAVQSVADRIASRWAQAPEIVVVQSVDDPRVPQAIRAENERQMQGGGFLVPQGVFYRGKVYLFADGQKSITQVAQTLFHEALGHYGLQAVFGPGLDRVLDMVAMARPELIRQKAGQYGKVATLEEARAAVARMRRRSGAEPLTGAALDASAMRLLRKERREVAEEVLAHMAQTQPELGFVRRAVAAIRTWLRENLAGFGDLRLTDDEIIRGYILPARNWVERGRAAGAPEGRLAFQRSEPAPVSQMSQADMMLEIARLIPQVEKAYEAGPRSARMAERLDMRLEELMDALESGLVEQEEDQLTAADLLNPLLAAKRRDGEEGDTEADVVRDLANLWREMTGDGFGRQSTQAEQVEMVRGLLDDYAFRHGGLAPGVTDQQMLDAARDAYEAVYGVRARQIERARTKAAAGVDTAQPRPATEAVPMFSRTSVGPTPPPQPGPVQRNRWQALKQRVMNLTSMETWDALRYKFQDRFIDLLRVQERIKALGGTISDLNDMRLGEELFHKRLAQRTQVFLKDELRPLLRALKDKGVDLETFEEFLHARHAPEANAAMAKRNPSQAEIDALELQAEADLKAARLQLQRATAQGGATQALEEAVAQHSERLAEVKRMQAFPGTEDERLSLSGMSDAQAAAVMAGLSPQQRADLDALAAQVDAINTKTVDSLVSYGLIDRQTAAAWRQAYKHYVPLHRDEAHPESKSHPIGQGYNVRGAGVRERVGSNQKVTNILTHIAMQREAALTRGEKNMVLQRLYLLVGQNPMRDFWRIGNPPMNKTIDPVTGTVRRVVDGTYRNEPNVVTLRIAGKDTSIIFERRNPQAERLATAIKSADIGDLGWVASRVGVGTRWFASVNTQYNPIFGLINMLRDVQAAALNLSTTPLAGKELQVLRGVHHAMRAVYRQERGKGAANPVNAQWVALWNELQEVGGTTGYRDLFSDIEDRAKGLQKEIEALERGQVSRAAHAVVDWLSDYNEAMENAVRVSAYKAALEQGMSKERAASLAKNLTVNFNRKGQKTRDIGAWYAFFNAAVQGTTRMVETLAGPAGRKIMAGGVALGAVNALVGMAFMGGSGDDDEDNWSKIPDFVKERSLVIPLSSKDYLALPLPLGFNFLPNIGRLAVEFAFGGADKTAGKQLGSLMGVMLDAFNPLGGAQPAAQMAAPTVIDPVVALLENKDWTGRPIYREDRSPLDPQPGTALVKDTASPVGKGIAAAINTVTGGTQYQPGAWSPTPDQIDYVIGQLTGGLGREISKAVTTAASPVTGDEVPLYKMPLVGRLVGTTRGASGQSEKFYENVKAINQAENELRGRARNQEDVAGYQAEEPLTQLAGAADRYSRRVSELRQLRRDLSAKEPPGYREDMKRVDEQIEATMRDLNARVRAVQRGVTAAAQ